MATAFSKISEGLKEAIAFSEGTTKLAKVHRLENLDIKKIRESTGLTQKEFAATFTISLGTLRHWERGDRSPTGPALVLLNVLAKNPSIVFEALAS